ncbi:MAG: hypothetical protein V4739_09715 [Pseudomonadota bacterium]
MADSKDTTSFFRKVVKFVASPTTDWGELGTTPSGGRESDFAKSELKAMIERKRRNDFVRKREFDMLRKVRREGLTGEQLAALDGSSRIDDSEDRNDGSAKPSEVKAKIDEIEQQMVGEGLSGLPRRNSSFYTAPTQPARLDTVPAALAKNLPVLGTRAGDLPPSARTPVAPGIPPASTGKGEFELEPVNNDIAWTPDAVDFALPPQPAKVNGAASPAAATTPPVVAKPVPAGAAPVPPVAAPRAALPMVGSSPSSYDASLAVEVNEIAHDPDLDEAVIAFANADFGLCEQSLLTMTGPHGVRAQHAETWLTLFDLYRAIGEHAKFESLAIDYAGQFGLSSPQWFSMPKMVAEAAASEDRSAPRRHAPVEPGTLGWVCPAHLDEEAVAELRSLALQMALPWVFDWADVNTIQPQACADLSDLFRSWIDQRLDMRWMGGESLFRVLAESAPTGDRDVDPVFWKLRFDALRMANRPDQFDEVAIDYCVTYEVSPPSWEPAKCEVRVSSGEEHSTSSHPLSAVSEISTTFVESQIVEETGLVEMASLELGGQLVGDIGDTLQRLDLQLLTAPIVSVSCAKLIRVDFIAAGDLLNWVLTKRSENRAVLFNDTHRLIALFFGAMGINEHARVKVRTV